MEYAFDLLKHAEFGGDVHLSCYRLQTHFLDKFGPKILIARANFYKKQVVLSNFDFLHFLIFCSDYWVKQVPKIWGSENPTAFWSFEPFLLFCIFSTLRGYISCREKGHMGFFHNSWSTIGVASKITKKSHVTIMATWVMAAWKRSQMQFLCYFVGLLLSKRLFSCQILRQKCYTITVDMTWTWFI